MTHSDKHFLIVGAGLAGLTVSAHLIQRGAKVTLVDNGINHSSIIAAGMINPLVFRRMTKSWRVDEFMPYLKTFYRELEEKTSTHFFNHVPIRRLHSSEQERGYWLKKQEREDFQAYMHRVTEDDTSYDGALNDFGSARLKETYFVDVHSFFPTIKQWISKNGSILDEHFSYTDLNGNSYCGVAYHGVIFCEGYLGKNNPWFGDLPLHQTKGETLVVRSEKLPDGVSLNRKCFMLPKGNQLFKIGATHSWHDASTHITEEGKKELLEKLSYIVDENVEVVEHEAGVRPTVIDRRPLIGTHLEHAYYHIFNGLGTKGYMLAPLLAKEFVEYLLDDLTLDKEVDISRFR